MSNSNSNQPDLDWSQVKETVKLLTVSVNLVESSIKTGDTSVNTLTDSFMSLVNHIDSINNTISSLEPSANQEKALNECGEIKDKIQSSIIAFQFYDRLQQTLSHVTESLKGLMLLIESPERLYNPIEWQKFQESIRAQYTMESEKIMFDAILSGKSVEEAVQLATEIDNTDEDDIELF